MTQKTNITLVYDQDCYLCKHFKEYIKLKKVADINFVDMNTNQDLINIYEQKGYDINHGMLIEIDGQLFQGKDALKKLEQLIGKEAWFDKIIAWCMQNPIILAIGYPIAQVARKVLLFFRKK